MDKNFKISPKKKEGFWLFRVKKWNIMETDLTEKRQLVQARLTGAFN